VTLEEKVGVLFMNVTTCFTCVSFGVTTERATEVPDILVRLLEVSHSRREHVHILGINKEHKVKVEWRRKKPYKELYGFS
jgi:hypothetical protein